MTSNLSTYPYYQSALLRAVDDASSSALRVALATENGAADEINRLHRGLTPLFLAVMRESSDCVTLLLEAGADPNTRCSGDRVPLYIAVMRNHVRIVHQLLDAGAHTAVLCTSRQISPLVIASALGLTPLVEMLLTADDCDVNQKGGQGTALFVCAQKDHRVVAAVLLADERFDPVLQEHRSETCLMAASAAGHCDFIRLLLAHGFDPLARDTDGRTALHVACIRGQAEAAKLLVRTEPRLLAVRDFAQRRSAAFYASSRLQAELTASYEQLEGEDTSGKRHFWAIAPPPCTATDCTATTGDLTVHVAGDAHFHAHRAVVFMRCPALTTRTGEVRVRHDRKFMRLLLEYLYTGAVAELDRLSAEKRARLESLIAEYVTEPFESVAKLVDSEEHADVRLRLVDDDGALVHAHRCILMCNAYFANLLSGDFAEGDDLIDVGGDVRKVELLPALRYLYGNESIDADDIETPAELFVLSQRLLMPTLARRLETVIGERFATKESAVAMWTLADAFPTALYLREAAYDALVTFYDEIRETDDFKQLLSSETRESLARHIQFVRDNIDEAHADETATRRYWM